MSAIKSAEAALAAHYTHQEPTGAEFGSSSTIATRAGPPTPPDSSATSPKLPLLADGPSFSEFFPWIKEGSLAQPSSQAQSALPAALIPAKQGCSRSTPSPIAKDDTQAKLIDTLRRRPLPAIPVTQPIPAQQRAQSPTDAASVSREKARALPSPVPVKPKPVLATPSPNRHGKSREPTHTPRSSSQATSSSPLPSSPPRPLPGLPVGHARQSSTPNPHSQVLPRQTTPPHQQDSVASSPSSCREDRDTAMARTSSTLSAPGQDHTSLYEESDPSVQSVQEQQRALHGFISHSAQRPDFTKRQGAGIDRHTYDFEAHPYRGGRASQPLINLGEQSNATSTSKDASSSEAERYYIFVDPKLPGYRLEKATRLTTPDASQRTFAKNFAGGPAAVLVRTPKQVCGWKAVLMHGGTPGDVHKSGLFKKEKCKAKVHSRTAYEVRQEPLQNSYDFRSGSGILATMHTSNRLFKMDWDIVVRDGRKLTWRISKTELALYLVPGDVKIATFYKAVPSSLATKEGFKERVGSVDIVLPSLPRHQRSQSTARIGTMPEESLIDNDLVIGSLIAVFAAKHGHYNVKAAYEETSDPFGKRLQKEQRQAVEREDVLLAMPRPGFARETESVLSDTTDEEEGNTHHAPRRTRGIPQSHSDPAKESKDRVRGWRKRYSGDPTTLRRASEEGGDDDDEGSQAGLTPAQRLAMSYRKSMAFS